MDPGIIVRFQAPAGSPPKSIDPVATSHEGCVMTPITGVAGVDPHGLITTLAVGAEVQPGPLLTVKL